MIAPNPFKWMLLAVAAFPCLVGAAATNFWTGSGNWTNRARWSRGQVPIAGESVSISGAVTLSAATAALAHYHLASGGTHTSVGWDTVLRAADVVIEGTLDHAPNTAAGTNAAGLWVPDNRVWIVCSNLTVAAGGRLLADERGFQGGWGSDDGKGPGSSLRVTTAQAAAGADHAGIGGKSFGRTYGDRLRPDTPGSGAGGWSGTTGHGGHGGGAIRIDAAGTVRVEGAITADGGDSFNQSGVSGGGSGGAINISCSRLAGADGTLSANGGSGGAHVWTPGGGGGGRIAIRRVQDVSAGVRFSVNGGSSLNNAWDGGPGTIRLITTPAHKPATGTVLLITNRAPLLPLDLQILVIGDSNTELGHFTGEMARLLEARYGYHGSGYHSALAAVGMGGGYLPHLSITNAGSWSLYKMVDGGKREPTPFIAPDGTAAISSSAGAHTDVTFRGTGIDLYWLASATGGAFSVAVDSDPPQTVVTTAAVQKVSRTRLEGLPPGDHTLTASVLSGTVSLLGVDARHDVPGTAVVRRAVVHKWGRSWSTTRDHIAIDAQVHDTALRLLAPSVVVLLLGTNDHNLSPYTSKEQFRDNLIVLIRRVQSALPDALVLVLTTNQIQEFAGNNDRLREYVGVMPQVVAATGAAYWSMTGWFGPWAANNSAGLFADNLHMNQQGGAKIAEKLLDVIMEELQSR